MGECCQITDLPPLSPLFSVALVPWITSQSSSFRSRRGLTPLKPPLPLTCYTAVRHPSQQKQPKNIIMDAIKKKMQAMKVEKDNAMDRSDVCEQVRIFFLLRYDSS